MATTTASIAARQEGRGTALLIIDMISSWDFPDARPLLAQASRMAPCIAALRKRCKRSGLPVIYANDNRGQWRSDFSRLVRASLEHGGAGAQITTSLAPEDDDYFVLKPKHSAFFSTPLELLLQDLQVRRLIVTGVSSDQCVLHTVGDARMRDYEVIVPADCIATQTAQRNRRVVAYFEQVMKVRIIRSPSLRLPRMRDA
jgi:nicotinamidase-related amidase